MLANQDMLKARQREAQRHAFNRTNELQIEHKRSQQDAETQQLKHTKLDFFPFVAGELIENGRREQNAQRRNDMYNYMMRSENSHSKKQSATPAPSDRLSLTTARVSQLQAAHQRGIAVSHSTLSPDAATSRNRDRLTRSFAPSVSMVKPLFDSAYVRPQDNARVIQDNAPAKQAAISDAEARHEDSLRKGREGRAHEKRQETEALAK